MVRKMLNNEECINLTKGEQNRDFLYVDDLLEVYNIILNNSESFSNFEHFRIGSGVNSNLRYILEFIHVNTNSKSFLNFGAIPYRNNELMTSSNDISKIKNLGWNANIGIDCGIMKVIEYEKLKRNK